MRAGYWQDLLSEEEVVAGMNTDLPAYSDTPLTVTLLACPE